MSQSRERLTPDNYVRHPEEIRSGLFVCWWFLRTADGKCTVYVDPADNLQNTDLRWVCTPTLQACTTAPFLSTLDCFCSNYRVSQEECARLRESVPYVKLYRYKPKHLYPKLNGYGDNGHRKVRASGVSTYCTPSVTPYSSLRMPDKDTSLANTAVSAR